MTLVYFHRTLTQEIQHQFEENKKIDDIRIHRQSVCGVRVLLLLFLLLRFIHLIFHSDDSFYSHDQIRPEMASNTLIFIALVYF